MLFFKIMEYLTIILIVVFITMQIIIPAIRGRALFPLFRKQRRLESEEAELNQLKIEQEMQKKIDTLKGDLKNETPGNNGTK